MQLLIAITFFYYPALEGVEIKKSIFCETFQGSHGFMKTHRWRNSIGAAINVEASGTGGLGRIAFDQVCVLCTHCCAIDMSLVTMHFWFLSYNLFFFLSSIFFLIIQKIRFRKYYRINYVAQYIFWTGVVILTNY